MIISKLQGGLGNQLFQWAIAKNLSIKFSCNFYLDTRIYSTSQKNITVRKFSLKEFPYLQGEELGVFSVSNLINIHDDFKFKDILINCDNDYYLNGYFQSEKYFESTQLTIRDELRMSDVMKIKLLQKYPDISDCVSIHIRRGDYVNQQHNHPILPIDYYEKAIEIVGGKNQLIVFSDDLTWCKNNLKFENITYVDDLIDVENLWLMSLCKHNIIANSTFSWWGAWLNNNPTKIVIAPNLWFGHKLNLNTSDIIPNNWIKI